MQKNPLDQVLNEIEKDALGHLLDDKTTLNALKKVLLFGIYYNGTMKEGEDPQPFLNFALHIDTHNVMTDEQLGRVLRAKTEGIVALELGFKELEQFKRLEVATEEKKNTAR